MCAWSTSSRAIPASTPGSAIVSATSAAAPLPLDDQLCYAIYSAGIAIQRVYKPLLDTLGLTYPQYLLLNVLWTTDAQTVGGIADQLALESSTLTPLLKRLESAGLVRRTRNPDNERQVVVALTPEGRALKSKAGCVGQSLVDASGQPIKDLGKLNRAVKDLRDAIYRHIGGWAPGQKQSR
ncbi:MAG: MarR family transcriptional regulator [Rhodospirillaceae bacterium]|nr:MarR family transcriptional regulator [Rhodospirillaceae bacterium]